MSAILHNEYVNQGVRTAASVFSAVWGWTRERLWPVYSAAIVLSVFEMLASSYEKQIMADHYYGNAGNAEGTLFGDSKAEIIEESKKLFHEEVSLSIKERIWAMPKETFRRVYDARMGDH